MYQQIRKIEEKTIYKNSNNNPISILFKSIGIVLIIVALGIFAASISDMNNHDCCSPIGITENLDMDYHYILNFPLSHFVHFTMEKKVTGVAIQIIPVDMLTQDRHYSRLSFSTDVSVGVGRECSASISDGTNIMTVILTGTDTIGYTTTNAFDLDVSTESFTLSYSQDAKGQVTKGFVIIVYWYK